MLILREETFRSVPAQGSLGPVYEVHGVFRNLSRATRGNGNSLIVNVIGITNTQGYDALLLGVSVRAFPERVDLGWKE